MSAHEDALRREGSLSERQAFLAMSDYIWRYANRAGDDLITLLGDTELMSDGEPTDPAAWSDWLESIGRARQGLARDGDSTRP